MRFNWLSVRYRLEYLVFRLAARLFLLLGLERASDFSGALWRRVAPYSKRHGRALEHLALAFPDKTATEREEICLGMWENLGRNFSEAFFLKEIATGDRIAYEGLEAFEAWANLPAGRVACAAHLANWELTILAATQRGLKPWSIYQKIKNPLVDEDISAMRSFLYTGGLVAKDPMVPRQFLRVVRHGGTIGCLADLRDFAGVSVSFFRPPGTVDDVPGAARAQRRLPDPGFPVCGDCPVFDSCRATNCARLPIRETARMT